jgi:hypothetical protein
MMDGRYNQLRNTSYYSYDDRYGGHSEDEEDFAYNPWNQRARPISNDSREAEGQGEVEGNKGNEKETEGMSSWLSRVSTSSQAQFAATAIVSGALVAGAIFGYQAVRRHERVKDLKSEIPDAEWGGGNKVGVAPSCVVGGERNADRRSEAYRFWGGNTEFWIE